MFDQKHFRKRLAYTREMIKMMAHTEWFKDN